MTQTYAPPSPSPGETVTTVPSPTMTTMVVPTTSPDTLPVTGPSHVMWVIVVALVCLAVGAAVVALVGRYRRV